LRYQSSCFYQDIHAELPPSESTVEVENRMGNEHQSSANSHLPAGLTPHTAGLASEYAREQGWGTNQEERTKTEKEKQNADGGRDYEYGAADFGDTAIDTNAAKAPQIAPKPAKRTEKRPA
jgi:hypothetical protein